MEWLQKILFQQQVQNSNSKNGFLSWAEVQNVALIISAPLSASKSELDQWIAKCGKRVTVFYVESNVKQASFSDWNCFTKEKRTLVGLPKADVLESLKANPFDLVICLSETLNYYEQSVALAIPAKLRVSSLNQLPYYSLFIERSGVSGTIHYLDTCVKYLNMIRRN
jgi:hypothetical protein